MSTADSYPDRACPDCGEAIPSNAGAGEACANCGFVFAPDPVVCPGCNRVNGHDDFCPGA